MVDHDVSQDILPCSEWTSGPWVHMGPLKFPHRARRSKTGCLRVAAPGEKLDSLDLDSATPPRCPAMSGVRRAVRSL